jgi:SSS family solute:Na+ symporter
VVFFFGVFWKRLNAKGCFWAMVIGFSIGIIRMLIDTPVTLEGTGYTPGSFLWIVNNINFQYFSILITIVSALVMIVVSYLTEQPDYAKITNLSFGTRTEEYMSASSASWDWREVVVSIVVLGGILGGYLYFTG